MDEHYTVYFIGRDGRIQRRANFMAPDDEYAKQVAKQLATNTTIELWQRARMIERLEPATR